METWKDITGFEGIYQISNLGNVKSLERLVKGKFNLRINKEKILKPVKDIHGYYWVTLYYGDKRNKRIKLHQLMAITFLNHIPCGHKLVVNHIDFNKENNTLNNLEIITQRENANQKHLKGSSQYVGVRFYPRNKKWVARIYINKKRHHLGYFDNEYDAHLAYQNKLKSI